MPKGKCIDCKAYNGEECLLEGYFASQPLENLQCRGFEPKQQNIKHPICPINLYFEGDESKCDASQCDWDVEDQSCSQACEIKQQTEQPKQTGQIRQFSTGATRDTDIGKLDYEGFFSPLVLQRYAQYLHKHRTQSDGKIRDADNWQKGIPIADYMKSKARHFISTWLIHRGFSTDDIEESLCAEIFNSMGMLFEILKEEK